MKKLIALLLALAMVLSLAACGTQQPDPTEAPVVTETPTEVTPETEAAPTTVVFTDDLGREVELPATIERIVPTGPLSQIILYAIAPDMFVGLAAKWYSTAEGFIPEEYLNLPFFGQLYNTADLNVEELALADPQVIIDIGQTMSRHRPTFPPSLFPPLWRPCPRPTALWASCWAGKKRLRSWHSSASGFTTALSPSWSRLATTRSMLCISWVKRA